MRRDRARPPLSPHETRSTAERDLGDRDTATGPPPDLEDPLAGAACELLASASGALHAGLVDLDRAVLRAGSSGLRALPPEGRAALAEAVAAAASAAPHAEGADGARTLAVCLPPALGGTAEAVTLAQGRLATFRVPAPDEGDPGGAAFRRAAAPALAVLSRADEVAAERRGLAASAALLSHVEELAKVGGWELVVASNTLLWSDALYAIHGLDPAAGISPERMLALYPSPARERLMIELERAATEGRGFELTTPVHTPAGEARIVRTVARCGTGPEGRMLYGITQDVTAEISSERRLWWAANHDPVTKLPNRLLFEDRFAIAVEQAGRDGRGLALVVIQIADFARLAAHSGYTVPDKHMLDIATRLAEVTRASDTLARTALDEFALVVTGIAGRADLAEPLERIGGAIEAMRRQDAGDGIVASAGVALFPEHGSGVEELVRAASVALARARKRLDAPVVILEAAPDARAAGLESVLGRARASLARGEFVPYYQPQMDIETGEIVGAEALVRWQTADVLLDAKDFSSALEDHEIGSLVARAVLDMVIGDMAELRRLARGPFRVSVNASRTEVLRNDFLDTFLQRCRGGNLHPTDFIIEITEDVILGVDDRALQDKISFLASSGVQFSLDDFGTGYASLIHITSFPIKEIKIDKQFIAGIETDRRKRAVVKGIVSIASSMGLHVIAEGVETRAQERVLSEIGCRYAQGYLYAFPLPFDEFAALLSRG